jgi:hypothetical protein
MNIADIGVIGVNELTIYWGIALVIATVLQDLLAEGYSCDGSIPLSVNRFVFYYILLFSVMLIVNLFIEKRRHR